MFRFLRSLQIFFQSGCTSLPFHQQCMRVPFFSHPCQHLGHMLKSKVLCIQINSFLFHEILLINLWHLFLFICFCFLVLGVWTQNLVIARQALYYLHHSTSHFCFGYCWDTVSFYAQAGLDWDSLIYTCWVAGMTGAWHCTQPLVEMVLTNFLPGLALNSNSPDVCLLVARITSRSHHIWLEDFPY
jgi:hypothetical protein